MREIGDKKLLIVTIFFFSSFLNLPILSNLFNSQLVLVMSLLSLLLLLLLLFLFIFLLLLFFLFLGFLLLLLLGFLLAKYLLRKFGHLLHLFVELVHGEGRFLEQTKLVLCFHLLLDPLLHLSNFLK